MLCYVNIMSASVSFITLQEIASKAGVSAMTVSRVLHQSPRVAQATREKVLEVTRRLKYQPDPHLARMMTLVRGRKSRRVRAMIAVIRETPPGDESPQASHQYVSLPDIRRRAEQHGYHTEEFWLGRSGMTPDRLTKILHARGVEGIIVSPQSSSLLCSQLDYTPYAAATFGYGLSSPSLHRAAGNMSLGIQMAVSELAARGYLRIGLAITQWVDARSQNSYSGAMLHFQQSLPPARRVPILLFPHNHLSYGRRVFEDWFKKHKPDALITFDAHVPDWLIKLGLRVPEDIGLVVHDWTENLTGFAGIYQRRDHVAAAAVDLVATQLLHHEHGVPEVPRQILISPAWIEGTSIRKAEVKSDK